MSFLLLGNALASNIKLDFKILGIQSCLILQNTSSIPFEEVRYHLGDSYVDLQRTINALPLPDPEQIEIALKPFIKAHPKLRKESLIEVVHHAIFLRSLNDRVPETNLLDLKLSDLIEQLDKYIINLRNKGREKVGNLAQAQAKVALSFLIDFIKTKDLTNIKLSEKSLSKLKNVISNGLYSVGPLTTELALVSINIKKIRELNGSNQTVDWIKELAFERVLNELSKQHFVDHLLKEGSQEVVRLIKEQAPAFKSKAREWYSGYTKNDYLSDLTPNLLTSRHIDSLKDKAATQLIRALKGLIDESDLADQPLPPALIATRTNTSSFIKDVERSMTKDSPPVYESDVYADLVYALIDIKIKQDPTLPAPKGYSKEDLEQIRNSQYSSHHFDLSKLKQNALTSKEGSKLVSGITFLIQESARPVSKIIKDTSAKQNLVESVYSMLDRELQAVLTLFKQHPHGSYLSFEGRSALTTLINFMTKNQVSLQQINKSGMMDGCSSCNEMRETLATLKRYRAQIDTSTDSQPIQIALRSELDLLIGRFQGI